MTAAPRDPAALPRLGWTLAALVLLWPLLRLADFRPAALFEPGNLAAMGHFLAGFLPLETSPDFLALLGRATVDTLAMATAGIALAVLLAVPLGVVLARSLSVAALGPGCRGWVGQILRGAARLLLAVLRGVPELVWALLFVRVFGLGPAAGVLALGITYGGMLGKVYGEILESTDARPARCLLEAGSGRLAALAYGLLPNAARELLSYTVYRWECAVRASVVMGFVGAGGLGQMLYTTLSLFQEAQASTVIIAMLAMAIAVDGASAWLRRKA